MAPAEQLTFQEQNNARTMNGLKYSIAALENISEPSGAAQARQGLAATPQQPILTQELMLMATIMI